MGLDSGGLSLDGLPLRHQALNCKVCPLNIPCRDIFTAAYLATVTEQLYL